MNSGEKHIAEDGKAPQSRFFYRSPYILFFSGVLITLLLSLYTGFVNHKRDRQKFDAICGELQEKINTRLHAHALLLRACAAFISSSDTVTSESWKKFIEECNIEENLSGIQAVGYACFVPASERMHLMQQMKTERPGFHIWPEGRDDFGSSVIYIEPSSNRNQRAFGFDMLTEPIRRRGMEKALDSNQAVLSGKVTLVQESDSNIQAGTLMFVPVYLRNRTVNTVQERRSALQGWVYTAYRMNNLMNGILGSLDSMDYSHIRIRLFDENCSKDPSLLYDSRNAEKGNRISPDYMHKVMVLNFYGKKWELRFTQDLSSASRTAMQTLLVVLCGFMISLLVFFLARSLRDTRMEASRIAVELTRDIRESETRFRNMFENHQAVMLLIDPETGFIVGANAAAQKFYGYSEIEFQCKKISEINTMPAEEITVEMQRAKQRNKNYFVFTHRLANGTSRNVEVYSTPLNFSGTKILLSIIHDITERKRMEEELHKSEKILRESIEFMPIPVGIADLSGKVIRYNHAFTNQFGYTLDEVPTILEWYEKAYRDPVYRKAVIDQWSEDVQIALRSGSPTPVREYEITDKWGERHWVDISMHPAGDLLVTTFYDTSQVKELMNKLGQSEEKFRSLFENITYGFALHETLLDDNGEPSDFNFLEVNRYYENFGGMKPEEVLGKTIREVHPMASDELIRKYASVGITRVPLDLEYYSEIYKKHIHIHVFSPAAGRFATLYEDITERKQQEALVLKLSAEQRTILNTVPFGISHIKNREVQWTNEAHDLIFGYEKGGTLGKHTRMLYPDDESFEELGRQGYAKMLSGEKYQTELQMLRRDHSVFWCRLTGQYIDSSKPGEGSIWVAEDISDRKKAEAVIQESEERYRLLFEYSGTGNLLIDQEGRYLAANKTAADVFGCTPEEVVGKSMMDFLPISQARKYLEFNRQLFESGGTREYEDSFDLGNRRKTFVIRDCILVDHAGKNPALLSVSIEITDRKDAEERLQKSEIRLKELNRTKDRLFSVIAHDLRGPFSSILGFAELLEQDRKRNNFQKIEQRISAIHAVSKSTLGLLENLLDWARSQTGQIKYEPESLSLKSSLSEVFSFLQSGAGIKNIRLVAECREDLKVFGDEKMVQTVLRNLVSNAIKFSRQGGTIVVFCSSDDGRTHIQVKDQGVGMDDDSLRNLFIDDRKSGSEGTSGERGSGLGLVLCKEFIGRMNGEIWAESVQGEGSTFHVLLPAV